MKVIDQLVKVSRIIFDSLITKHLSVVFISHCKQQNFDIKWENVHI